MPRQLPVVGDQPHGTCVRLVPIFAQLTADQQDAVAAFAKAVDLAPGELLHRAGEATRVLFVVHSGRLRVAHLSPGGRRRLLRVAGPGEVVGEHAFLTGEPPEYEVEALEPARVCAFGPDDLGRLVTRYPAIGAGLLRAVSGRLADAERRLAQAAVEVPVRLAAYLLDLPVSVAGEGYRVRLPWPKKDVASYLGTTPESLSRALDRLQQDGTIGVSGRTVRIVDPQALEALAAAAS